MTSRDRTKKSRLKDLRRQKQVYDNRIREYDDSDFPGRIETQEVTRARNNSACLEKEIQRLTA